MKCNDVSAVERCFREDAGRTLASLARALGDLDAAEEALQDAYLVALERWPRDGFPEHPSAWIRRTARNRAVDRLRRERSHREKLSRLAALDVVAPDADPFEGDAVTAIPDERLGLIFACCHPGLGVDARIALTLSTLGGLSTEEIADAFLVPYATMAQRLVRVKRKIRQAAIPFDVPPSERLAERLADVGAVLYLIFNQGYLASSGERLVRHDLCEEAIRLTRVLGRLLPQEPEVRGLLALMLFQHSRRDARTDTSGVMISLGEQDRRLWDRVAIAEANDLVELASRHRVEGAYQLQAMIAAQQANAPEPEGVDWEAIAALYARLAAIAPSPVVDLNRAVALGFACGPLAGLLALEAIEPAALESYHLAHVARADLLRRLGRAGEAHEAYASALRLTQNAAERSFLENKIAGLAQAAKEKAADS